MRIATNMARVSDTLLTLILIKLLSWDAILQLTARQFNGDGVAADAVTWSPYTPNCCR